VVKVATTTIEVIWYAIGALWLVMAFNNKRTLVRRGFTFRSGIGIVLVSLLLRGRHNLNSIHHHLWNTTPTWGWLGVVLMVIGAAWAVWARFTIGTNWSGSVTLKENHELIERGPYAYVRHPIYSALFTMLLGTAIAFGQVETTFIFAAVLVIFIFKMRTEEQLMTEAFPDDYPAYRRRVKAIIPFVV
jgi:protein-S-isoprenylcysteine O-methyltransferase Ste14